MSEYLVGGRVRHIDSGLWDERGQFALCRVQARGSLRWVCRSDAGYRRDYAGLPVCWHCAQRVLRLIEAVSS